MKRMNESLSTSFPRLLIALVRCKVNCLICCICVWEINKESLGGAIITALFEGAINCSNFPLSFCDLLMSENFLMSANRFFTTALFFVFFHLFLSI